MLFNELHVQRLVCMTITPPHYLDMCDRLPGTFALSVVLSHTCAQLNPFSLLSTLDVTYVRKDTGLVPLL